MYVYSLVVDGQIVDTKQMILTKQGKDKAMKKIVMIIGALLLSGGCLLAQDSPTQDTATHGYR